MAGIPKGKYWHYRTNRQHSQKSWSNLRELCNIVFPTFFSFFFFLSILFFVCSLTDLHGLFSVAEQSPHGLSKFEQNNVDICEMSYHHSTVLIERLLPENESVVMNLEKHVNTYAYF